jgi:peptidoglycan/LPS O-acetylase OafA/YrhL
VTPPAPDTRFFQPGLTGLRAFAACWVMLFHLNALVGPRTMFLDLGFTQFEVTHLATIGWVGVDIFFVLSGFLLTTHLLEARSAGPWPAVLRRYLVARIRRVIPAYWAQIAILFAVAVIATRALPEWTAYIPLNALMIHNLVQAASQAINPVYWTLPIEFGFYLALPLFLRLLVALERAPLARRLALLALVVACVFAITWTYRYIAFRMYSSSPVNTIVWATSQLPGSFDEFVLGSAAAAAMRWRSLERGLPSARAREALSSAFLVVGCAGLFGMMYFLHRIHAQYWSGHWALIVWHTIASGFIALGIAGIALAGRPAKAVFANPVAMFLGTVSYSIYLWHFPIALWIAHAIGMQGMTLGRFSLVVVPVVIVASALSYYVVERPFIHSARRPASAGDAPR